MKTEICRRLGIALPIFAFSHCRDVVVAVSKAGGLGVLRNWRFTRWTWMWRLMASSLQPIRWLY